MKRRAGRRLAGWDALIAFTVLSQAVARAALCAPPGTTTEGGPPDGPESTQSAEAILAAQPRDLVDRLMTQRVLVLQEVEAKGPLRGDMIVAYVIFERPVDRVYRLLAQSARQTEFRPELTSIETVEMGPRGPIDEQHLKILFRSYVFRIAYQLFPERRRIEWNLDDRFENDLAHVSGFWALYEMADGRTLGRSGTSVDVGPAVPAMLQDWITRKNVPETMKRVQRWVESDGSDRP